MALGAVYARAALPINGFEPGGWTEPPRPLAFAILCGLHEQVGAVF